MTGLTVGEIADVSRRRGERKAHYHLVIAADVFVYIGDLAAVCAAVARVLAPDGLFGFTVETHEGEGVIVA